MASENPETVEELVDFDEEEETEETKAAEAGAEGGEKRGYVGIHSSGFRDFLLKPELVRAVVDAGFEHPSEVQHECIPQAVLGMDVICQAKSGMGKTAVFALTTLHMLEPVDGQVGVLVLSHTRELAFQISNEYARFSKYMPDIKVAVFYGGVPIRKNKDKLKNDCPHIVVGTPGRIKQLSRDADLKLDNVKHFVLDECDRMLEGLDMRADVQEIFRRTPHDKQVMLFSATLSKAIRPVCRRFCQDPFEIYIDNETKLTLHGLQQYVLRIPEAEKTRKLTDLIDSIELNQMVIFVSKVARATELNRLLVDCGFPSICIHSGLNQAERISRYQSFKDFNARILVSTDLFGRGMDVERVNVVINYDMVDGETGSDQYLHRVGRAGRFGTRGLAISFISSQQDEEQLARVQERFEVEVPDLPDEIDTATYM